MSAEIAIFLNNVSKCYKRYARPVERLKEIFLPGKSLVDEFWALQNINLEVFKGETLGIIGQNGSGKSTLLQIIAGTLTPTTGQVQVSGRISALLELGSGFNPEFTGRQNVFFNGQLLGLSHREVEEKFDYIVAFADIGDFIDQPVKTYSSGMFVRLAFAVVVNVNPDILIVDEALAVGDIYFQQKCFERLRKLKDLGTTLLFVSHDTSSVYNLCKRAVLIQAGEVVLNAQARQVIDLYEAKLLKKADVKPDSIEIKSVNFEGKNNSNSTIVENIEVNPNSVKQKNISYSDIAEHIVIKSPEVNIHFVELTDIEGQKLQSAISDQFVQLSIGVMFLQTFNDPHIGFKIRDRTGIVLFQTDTYCMRQPIGKVTKGTLVKISFEFYLRLGEGEYTITVGVADSRSSPQVGFERTLAYVHNTTVLKVLRNKDAIFWSGVVSLAPSVSIHRQIYV